MSLKETENFELLIIDDSADDVFSIKRLLRQEGLYAHCLRVDSLESLHHALQAQHWDVALCDVKMPLLTPEIAIHAMNQDDSVTIPVILMSGIADIASLSDLIRGGVRDFLPKDQLYRLVPMLKRELKYLEASKAQQVEHQMFVEAQKMEAVATLAGGVAHDFNNILMALMGLQWVLKEKYERLPELIENIDKMDDLCVRASNLVKQLLGFARKGIVQVESIDLASFIHENQQLFRMSVPEYIQVDWPERNQTILINADVTQLQQVFINMINNARDAARQDKQPHIALVIKTFEATDAFLQQHQVQGRNWVSVSILNNGTPIPKQVESHIFEPFFTTKDPGKGTGLGLAMVYGTMQSLGGFVDIAAKEEQVHTFCTQLRLFFPASQAKVATLPPHSPIYQQKNKEIAAQHQYRLLIADDEEAVRDVIGTTLEMSNYQVTSCCNGLEALQAFRQTEKKYHAIILDVVMPKMIGPEVAKKIRESSSVPIIIISGYDIDETLDMVKGIKGLTVVRKPFSPSSLLSTVATLIHDTT